MPTSAKSVANIDAKIDSPGLKTNGGMAVQPCCMLQTLALFRMLKKSGLFISSSGKHVIVIVFGVTDAATQ